MLRLDITIMGYLAAAVMLVGGGLWIVFDSPHHPVLRSIVGLDGAAAKPAAPLQPGQISALREEVEQARAALKSAQRQGGRAGVSDALQRYDQAQRRYTAARLQALEAPGEETFFEQ